MEHSAHWLAQELPEKVARARLIGAAQVCKGHRRIASVLRELWIRQITIRL